MVYLKHFASSRISENLILLINQTSAQLKIQEAWKANKNASYCIRLTRMQRIEEGEPSRQVRASMRKEIREGGKTKQAEQSFPRETPGGYGTKHQ